MNHQPLRAAGVEARREAILNAAKEVFFEAGYAVASMDRIAEVAGVTKRTVYAHFESKDALFAAVVDRGCRNVAAQLPGLENLPADPAEGLRLLARRTRELMRSPGCIRLERIVAAEAERHPQFAATLREAFAAGEQLLADALARWVAAGRLKPHDTAVAGRMLNDQIACAASFRGLLDEAASVRDDAALEQALAIFLDAYAA